MAQAFRELMPVYMQEFHGQKTLIEEPCKWSNGKSIEENGNSEKGKSEMGML